MNKINNNEDEIVAFTVCKGCRKSLPCCHDVHIIYKNKKEVVMRRLSGIAIKKMYEKLEQDVPEHFVRY
jgi:hypothetical protein